MSTTQLTLTGAGRNAEAAVLKFNGMDLMIRQDEIRMLEPASAVDSADPERNSVGWIGYMRQRWPVYCLSEQLELMDSIPPSRRTCVLLTLANGHIGVLCDDVSILKQATGRSYELPLAMKKSETPILGLLAYDNGILSVSSANRLAAYVEHQIQSL